MFWKREKSTKFIVTHELGKLAKWLRVLGYDTVYFDSAEKKELIITSLRENRVILTREAQFSRFSGMRMIRIKNDFVEDQIKQVLKEVRLKANGDKIFTRCTICNSQIEDVIKKSDIKKEVPLHVYETQTSFKKCPSCKKIYWKGTHWKLATNFLKKKAKT